MAATRSKSNRPTRPQFRPPTMASKRVMMLSAFMLVLPVADGVGPAPEGRPISESAFRRKDDLVDDVNDAVACDYVACGDVGLVDLDGVALDRHVDHLAVHGLGLVETDDIGGQDLSGHDVVG